MGLEKINLMRKQAGLSIDELSLKSGIPKGTVSKITAGITKNPSIETIKTLVHCMGFTLDDLDSPNITKCVLQNDVLDDEERELIKKYRELDEHGKEVIDSCLKIEHKRIKCERESRTHKLQMVCDNEESKPEDNVFQLIHSLQDASAGTGYYLDSEQMVPWTVKYNELTRKADFSVDVNGDSMEPKFHDGDTLLIRQQPSVDIGEIGLYIVDGKGYVKQQGETCLISLNPDYGDIHTNEYSSVKCVGKVIGVLEPEWIVEK